MDLFKLPTASEWSNKEDQPMECARNISAAFEAIQAGFIDCTMVDMSFTMHVFVLFSC